MPEHKSWFKRRNQNIVPHNAHQQEALHESEEARKRLTEQIQAFFTNVDTKVAAEISAREGSVVRDILDQIHSAAPRHHKDPIDLSKINPALHKYITNSKFSFRLPNAEDGPAFLYMIDTSSGATSTDVTVEVPGGWRSIGVSSRGSNIRFDHARIEGAKTYADERMKERTIIETYSPNAHAYEPDIPLMVEQRRGNADNLLIRMNYTNINADGDVSLQDNQYVFGKNAGIQCGGKYSAASNAVTWNDRLTAPQTEINADSITFSNSQNSAQEVTFPTQDNLFTRIQETTQYLTAPLTQ